MNKKEKDEFWTVYDEYCQTLNTQMRPVLSKLLAQVEEPNRRTQILRPKKGWNTILGWQVLRDQEFLYGGTDRSTLHEGEILAWTPHFDRDVYLTRLPGNERVAGGIIRPGFHLSEDAQGDIADYEWDQTVRRTGITDERGLYLPIFELETLMKLCDQQIATIKPRIINYLNKEKDIPLQTLNKL